MVILIEVNQPPSCWKDLHDDDLLEIIANIQPDDDNVQRCPQIV
jgi:hypothetical protein